MILVGPNTAGGSEFKPSVTFRLDQSYFYEEYYQYTDVVCPQSVTKENWDRKAAGPHADHDYSFSVALSGHRDTGGYSVEVRQEAPSQNAGWDINLRFTCSHKPKIAIFPATTYPEGEMPHLPPPFDRCLFADEGTPCVTGGVNGLCADPAELGACLPCPGGVCTLSYATLNPTATPTKYPTAPPTQLPTGSPTRSRETMLAECLEGCTDCSCDGDESQSGACKQSDCDGSLGYQGTNPRCQCGTCGCDGGCVGRAWTGRAAPGAAGSRCRGGALGVLRRASRRPAPS